MITKTTDVDLAKRADVEIATSTPTHTRWVALTHGFQCSRCWCVRGSSTFAVRTSKYGNVGRIPL